MRLQQGFKWLNGSLMGIALFTLGAMLVQSVMTRLEQRTTQAQYLLLSFRSVDQDAALIALSEQMPNLHYASNSNSHEFVSKVLYDLKKTSPLQPLAVRQTSQLKASKSLLLVIERKDRAPVITENFAQIQALVFDLQKVALRREQSRFLTLGLLGIVLGSLFARALRRGSQLMLSAMLLIALYKAAFQCPTCPHVFIVGIEAAQLGVLVYSALLIGISVQRTCAFVLTLLPTLCALFVLWQLHQIWNGSEFCLPCSLLLMLHLALGISALLTSHEQQQSKQLYDPVQHFPRLVRLRPQALLLCLAIGALPLLSMRWPLDTQKKADFLLEPTVKKQWIGKSIEQVPIMGLGVVRKKVVLIGMPDCAPCQLAKQALLNQTAFDVCLVQLKRAGEEQSLGMASIDYEQHPQAIGWTPTILVVNAQGRIVSEMHGWARDPEAQDGLLKTLERAVNPAPLSAPSVNKQSILTPKILAQNSLH